RASNSNDIEFFVDNLKVGALTSFDMEASSIISPVGTIYNSPSPIKAVFTNKGSNSLSGKYYANISDATSSIIYSDSVSFSNVAPNEADTIEFNPFTFLSNGNYSLIFFAKANGDLNFSNDTLAINFYAQSQNNNLVVVYNNSNQFELENKYSVFEALNSLSIPFDSLDRDSGIPDLASWNTVIWCEEEDIPSPERSAIISYLNSGTTNSQKQLLIAGDDIGFNHGRSTQPQFDSLFYWYYLHAKFFVDDGNGVIDNSGIIGDAVNNSLRDSLISFFPDGIGTNFGSVPAYRFAELSSQSDTVAGIAFDGASYNVLYYGFEFREIATSINPSLQQLISGSLDWFNNASGQTPVELTSFKADVTENKVKLSWTTATEKNNNGFSIERKSRGESFKQIAFVKGKGTATEKSTYFFEDEKPNAGIYIYRLKQIDYDGSFDFSNEIAVEISVPNKFALEQNYPNPFNPSTKIRYSIPTSPSSSPLVKGVNEVGFVTLKVYDIIGNEVATLVNKKQAAGTYDVEFKAKGLSSGVYFYRLEVKNPESGFGQAFISTKKMLIIK
ncbi:MAG: hypothetical protein ABI550_08410, partial [Ignavibacteriaceae bacterium]